MPGEYAKPEMPVQILFRRSANAETYVAVVFNKATEGMTLDVTVLNSSDQHSSQTQVSVEPMSSVKIGIDANPEMRFGDRVTLHNEIYNDFVALVPNGG